MKQPTTNSTESTSSQSISIQSTNYYYCYLLRSVSKAKSRAGYVGFTTDPAHRLKQHNGDLKAGGAYRTSVNRPWKFVCIVSRFPNKIVALQFEWQWQHIDRSRHFKASQQTEATTAKATTSEQPTPSEVGQKRKRSLNSPKLGYPGKIAVLSQLLTHPLWRQLNLIVYFLDKDIQQKFYQFISPSKHTICEITMDVVSTLQSEKRKNKAKRSNDINHNNNSGTRPINSSCPICRKAIGLDSSSQENLMVPRRWQCPHCLHQHHLTCTARRWKDSQTAHTSSSSDITGIMAMILPSHGKCENCHYKVVWSDLVRRYLTDATATTDPSSQCDEEDDEEDNSDESTHSKDSITSDEDVEDGEDEEEDESVMMSQNSAKVTIAFEEKERKKSRIDETIALVDDLEDGPFTSPPSIPKSKIVPSSNLHSPQPLAYFENEDDFFYHESYSNFSYLPE